MTVSLGNYTPPGVRTEAVPGPQIGVTTVTPTAVGIFGDTRRSSVHTERITIPWDTITGGEADPEDPNNPTNTGGGGDGTDPGAGPMEEPNPEDPVEPTDPGDEELGEVTRTPNSYYLVKAGIDIGTVAIVDPVTGTIFDKGTDYVVEYIDSQATEGQRVAKITRVVDGALDENFPVQISYNYTPEDYFVARSFYDYDDVRDAFGPAFDDNGTMVSELTLAAAFAFQNGANEVVLSPLNVRGSGTATVDQYIDALNRLSQISSVAIVCSASGRRELFDLVKQHVRAQSNNAAERRAILGLDGVATTVTSGDRLVEASKLSERRVALVSPSKFNYFNTTTNTTQELGSQFLACAVAGLSVSMSPAQPLTRKSVSGIDSITTQEVDQVKTQESAGGLLVVEQTRRGSIRIRHGVTTNPASLLTKEWSIIGQEDTMAIRMRSMLDDDGIIGSPIDDTTLINVKASADTALQALVRDGVIRRYANLKVRQTTESPDVIEIRYEWQASIPLNYIVVRYSIDLTTGTVSGSDSTTSEST